MAKITSSRMKFNEARRVSKKLHSLLGDNLKAVFVVGSVASNVALPNSDIDLLVVLQKCDYTVKQRINQFIPKVATHISSPINTILPIDAESFESVKHNREITDHWGFHDNMLLTGSIPIFGKDYAMAHRDCWNLPRSESIKRKYPQNWDSMADFEKHLKEMQNRTAFKRSKTGRARFMPI